MRLRSALGLAMAAVVVASGCSSDGTDNPGPEGTSAVTTEPTALDAPTVTFPAGPAAVLGGATPTELAIQASQALFGSAPVAVLIAAGADPSGASSLAIELGVPLLLSPAAAASPSPSVDPSQSPPATSAPPPTPADEGSAVVAELDRLGASMVVAVGVDAGDFAERDLAEVDVVDAPDGTSAIEDLPAGSLPEIPQIGAPPKLAGLTVTGTDAAAASATVQAAGGVIHELEVADPRTDSAVISGLADLQPDFVIGLGPSFGSIEQFTYRVSVAETGVELPGGGQVPYPYQLHVALYGNPTSAALGSLGEQSVADSVTRVTALAAEYQEFTEQTVVPTFEVISSVASSSPSSGGDYSTEMSPDEIRPYIDAARESGIYVMLDLQPGRSDFLTQAKLYEEFLKEPFVGLALDPEWRLKPNQVHLEQVGTVTAAEINTVVTWLADLTRDNQLPQKILMLHQFKTVMISDREQVDTSRDELAVVIHVDGFGPTGAKFATWNAMRANPPPNVWWGWKNFIDEDSPTLTPEQTMQVEPVPQFVSYQ